MLVLTPAVNVAPAAGSAQGSRARLFGSRWARARSGADSSLRTWTGSVSGVMLEQVLALGTGDGADSSIGDKKTALSPG